VYTHKYLITLFYVNRQAISKVIVKHKYDLIRLPLITSLRKINCRYRKNILVISLLMPEQKHGKTFQIREKTVLFVDGTVFFRYETKVHPGRNDHFNVIDY